MVIKKIILKLKTKDISLYLTIQLVSIFELNKEDKNPLEYNAIKIVDIKTNKYK